MSKCFHHPETDATGYCRQCGKGLCAACRRDVRGVVYCEDCLAALTASAAAAPGAPNPGLAAALAFIPGVGAIYNGEYLKALVYILIVGGTISLLDSRASRGIEPLLGLFLTGFWIYMVVEAYQTAKRRAAGLATGPGGWEPLSLEGGKATPVGPVILIVLGVILLLNTLDIFQWRFYLWRFWPLILIALGAWLLWRRTAPPPS